LGALIIRPFTPLLAALLMLGLAGCTAWPPPGQGGAAERGRASLPAGTGPALATRLSCALGRFEQARRASEEAGMLTGRVDAAAEVAARAQREVHGGLTRDAALSLDRLEAETVALLVQIPGPPQPPPVACS
jgi:hypothetical protein